MTPVTQSRVGEDGTCFRSCLASIFDLKEAQVPDFSGDGDEFFGQVDDYLATRGLTYRRVPVDSAKPSGYSTIEGISPRGGLHACVAKDGKLIHDPHPQDGTGRGLVEPRYYGLLEPIAGRVRDKDDMMTLRKNTTKQGGPFFMQETEKNGTERTIPVRELSKGADASATSWAALLLAVYALYKRHDDKPTTYDLTKYQPPKRSL